MHIQKRKHLQKFRKRRAKIRTISQVINAVISGDYFLTALNNGETKIADITINKTFNRNEFGANFFHPYVYYKMITI